MRQRIHSFITPTRGKGLYNINGEITAWVRDQGLNTGLLTVFIAHTSASLVIQENADPDVLDDLNDYFSRLVREDDPHYRHTTEGSDDMPAHIRSALTQTQISIPLTEGKLALGIWQDVYIFEHRSHPHQRKIFLHLIGE